MNLPCAVRRACAGGRRQLPQGSEHALRSDDLEAADSTLRLQGPYAAFRSRRRRRCERPRLAIEC
jgi:hypothetical protein